MKTLTRFKARIRLARFKEKRKEIEDLAFSIRKALDRDNFTEEDKALVLKIVVKEEKQRVNNKVKLSMSNVLINEKAYDLIKAL